MKDKSKIDFLAGEYSLESRLVHGQFKTPKWEFHHHVVPPLTLSTTFRLDSVERGAKGFEKFGKPIAEDEEYIYIYDRLDEPTRGMLEDRMAFIEEGEIGVGYSSGMAAISAAIGVLCKSGSQIVAHRTIYGCTHDLFTKWLPRFDIEVTFIDMTDVENLRKSIKKNTRVVYFETPANPTLELIDIRAVKEVVDEANKNRDEEDRIYIVVDNTFATSWCQRPISLGADFVVHSLTKNISGFGTHMGGIVIAPKKFQKDLMQWRKDFGAVLSPMNAWSILVYGLSTLPLRMKRQVPTAQKVAEFLESHPKVKYVSYPGLDSFPQKELARRQMISPEGEFSPGIMIYFYIAGDGEEARQRAKRLMNYIAEKSYTITLAVSLGQLRTLIEHPASMTHSGYSIEELKRAGIAPEGVRLSIGIESPEDIIKDLKEALEHC